MGPRNGKRIRRIERKFRRRNPKTRKNHVRHLFLRGGTVARNRLLDDTRRVFLVSHPATATRHENRPADMAQHKGALHVLCKKDTFHCEGVRAVMVQAFFQFRNNMDKPIFEIFCGFCMKCAIFEHLNLVARLFQKSIAGRN